MSVITVASLPHSPRVTLVTHQLVTLILSPQSPLQGHPVHCPDKIQHPVSSTMMTFTPVHLPWQTELCGPHCSQKDAC